MLTLSAVSRMALGKRDTSYGWVWRNSRAAQAEFRAIVDVARRYIAEPPPLDDCFSDFPHCDAADAVLTGERGALSQHVIYGLARVLNFNCYLEVGTRYGYSIGAVMAASRSLRRAVTIDPFVNPDEIRANLATLNRPDVDVQIVTQMSRDFDTEERFDAIYVDGDHSYEAAFGDLMQYWHYVRAGGLMLVDDTINRRADGQATRQLIGVRWAVRDFLQQTDDIAAAVTALPTYSGFAIIQKAD